MVTDTPARHLPSASPIRHGDTGLPMTPYAGERWRGGDDCSRGRGGRGLGWRRRSPVRAAIVLPHKVGPMAMPDSGLRSLAALRLACSRDPFPFNRACVM